MVQPERVWYNTSLIKSANNQGGGTSSGGGSPSTVAGDRVAFGCCEEKLMVEIFGCKARGRAEDRAFDHATGRGWVRARDGYTTTLSTSRVTPSSRSSPTCSAASRAPFSRSCDASPRSKALTARSTACTPRAASTRTTPLPSRWRACEATRRRSCTARLVMTDAHDARGLSARCATATAGLCYVLLWRPAAA